MQPFCTVFIIQLLRLFLLIWYHSRGWVYSERAEQRGEGGKIILKIKLRGRTVFWTTTRVTGLLEEVELMCWVEVSVVVVVVVVGKLLLELVEIAEIPLVVAVVVVGKLLLELVEIAEIPLVQPIIQKKTVIPNFKKRENWTHCNNNNIKNRTY